MRHVTEYAPAKTGNFRVILYQFSKDPACYEKYLKKDKLNSLHLTYKNACDVEVHSFPRVKLEEACSLIGIDNTRAFFFAPNGGYGLYVCLCDAFTSFVKF